MSAHNPGEPPDQEDFPGSKCKEHGLLAAALEIHL